MQIFVTAAGVVVALVFIAVSAAMNYTFLSSLGRTPLESHLLGAVSLAADGAKALLPLLCVIAYRSGRRVLASSAFLAFVLFTAASFLSAIGFTAVNRVSVATAASVRIERQSALKAESEALRMRRDALPAHRPAAVVAELLGAARQDRRWTSSKACTEATEPKSRQHCEAYFRLRAEHATAVEADTLDARRAAVQAQLSPDGGTAADDPDPQVRVLSAALGIDGAVIQRLLVMLVAVIIEVGSGLGLYFALAVRPERKRETEPPPAVPAPVEPEPSTPEPLEVAAPPATQRSAPDQPLHRDPEIMRAILRRPVGG